MNSVKCALTLIVAFIGVVANGQDITVTSHDKNITISISNEESLSYSVSFRDHIIVNPSRPGFELKGEPAMKGNNTILDQSIINFNVKWASVMKSKHAEILKFILADNGGFIAVIKKK